MTLPRQISPMLATLSEPFDAPDFFFEVKWDGLRCIAFIEGETQRLQSRNFKEYGTRFPELSTLREQIDAKDAVLDGEIVTFYQGKPNFLRLQPRIHARASSTIERYAQASPSVFIAFDLLYLNGRSLMDLPLIERRNQLSSLIHPGPILQLSEATESQGLAFYEAVKGLGLEGMVGKASHGRYLPGKRSSLWRKVKVLRLEPFIICGFTTNPTGRRDLSALALGGLVEDQLTYFGLVGTGLSQQEINRLLDILLPTVNPRSPFVNTPRISSPVFWVEPRWVCEVEYLELTGDAHLRHPLYRRLRTDLGPSDCIKG